MVTRVGVWKERSVWGLVRRAVLHLRAFGLQEQKLPIASERSRVKSLDLYSCVSTNVQMHTIVQ